MSNADVVQQPPFVEDDQGKVKKRNLFKTSNELSYQGRKCPRCSTPFGRFYNTGALCLRCKHKICRQCRIEIRPSNCNKEIAWICNTCNKLTELHIVSDKWPYDNVGCKGVKKSNSPIDILKHSIRRAWTINGPPPRWSTSRTSPELRLYRSLPVRHRGYRQSLEEEKFIDRSFSASLEIQLQHFPENDDRTIEGDKNLPTRNEIIETSKLSFNERTNLQRNTTNDVPLSDAIKIKKSERHATPLNTKNKIEDDNTNNQEQTPIRISLIKPPRILSKFITTETKTTQTKHTERKSSIPIFKRSSKEFEDINSPQESPKRSLIPQRYRGSTDDLRKSREDISVPSLIPKLLSPRNKEDRLKRQDSRDDIRSISKTPPRDVKEEDGRSNLRIFRRDSREDVGRESTNSNANAWVATKGKLLWKEERPERTDERVGDIASKPKSNEQTTAISFDPENKEDIEDKLVKKDQENSNSEETKSETYVLQVTMFDIEKTDHRVREEQNSDTEKYTKYLSEDRVGLQNEKDETLNESMKKTESEKNIDSIVKELMGSTIDSSNASDVLDSGEQKNITEGSHKKSDEFNVVRRKFSKEEFSNPDDTDDNPNRRCSSHLSPEASPLSTRSSRYSPRESESEPTPALPRKTVGDSYSASQRIRDAITRTRRESNSSARYESSGSESIRLSESGLHEYVELARKVKFFNNSGTLPPSTGSNELMHRDSATSAGEDEPHDDGHGRIGSVSSQGRTIFRRRRQFDAQGARRRGRSHARNCYGEELQNLQTLHVIGRDGRQHSPTGNQNQEQLTDYRRLVFISSDSSSGREEDDADSSCSSSSYLNGLPRGHAQSLDDCDWDYFESGSLPLPSSIPVATIGPTGIITNSSLSQDSSCCPGRGSSACQTCGGSQGANVLPVPVPIPVPVPYPVPVPASLWTGEFAAAASSMISGTSDNYTDSGTLRLRNDATVPWFTWQPRFSQALHGTRFDPRLVVSSFDPTTYTFRTGVDHSAGPKLYESSSTQLISPTEETQQTQDYKSGQDEKDDAKIDNNLELSENSIKKLLMNKEAVLQDSITVSMTFDESNKEKEEDTPKEKEEDFLQPSFESRGQRMFRHSEEDSGSSSGRSSADSSDLDDDSTSHRFSKVFVVNDDSLTSDDDVQDNEDEEEGSDYTMHGGVTLKRITALPEEDSVVLQRVRFLNEDFPVEMSSSSVSTNRTQKQQEEKIACELKDNSKEIFEKTESDESKRKKKNYSTSENEYPLGKYKFLSEEIYVANDIDDSENEIQLKSVKILNPDDIDSLSTIKEPHACQNKEVNVLEQTENNSKVEGNQQKDSEFIFATTQKLSSLRNLDSIITPDSLEVSISNDNIIRSSTPTSLAINNDETRLMTTNTDYCRTESDKHATLSRTISGESFDQINNNHECDASMKSASSVCLSSTDNSSASLTTDSSTSTETNTLGSEVSSDELHEYEVTPLNIGYEDSTASVLFNESNEGNHTIRNILLNEMNENISRLDKNETILDQGNNKLHDEMQERHIGVEVFGNAKSNDSSSNSETAHVSASYSVRGESLGSEQVVGGIAGSGSEGSSGKGTEGGSTPFRLVERRPSAGKENGSSPAAISTKEFNRDGQYFSLAAANSNNNNNNKYRSFVMITQEPTTYQPVSVITSDTTTLLQPNQVHTTGQGLAGYFQLALEAASDQPQRKNGQLPRRPLMVKRLGAITQNHSEPEIDSGLSVGSASESDDVSVKNGFKVTSRQDISEENVSKDRLASSEQLDGSRVRVSSQSSDDNSGSGGGIVILEEGLADDDSWVEEVSHDEDEPGATTATEESSEDEANNLGDREEELRGYHRQAIDFTLHTIIEESCEESEAEPSLTLENGSKKQRPPSASELEKYFFFGLGGDNNNPNSNSREIDSLSETSSIYSEGLESLGQDEMNSSNQSQDRSNSSDNFLNSSRLEKYFLSEFLNFDQDRRDSDGSVGSDSEGRPSPEAQRRKRLVRARGTGRSHSSSLDNLLALTQSSQNLSSQSSLQDLSPGQDTQETQSEGSSTETDIAEEAQTPVFGTDGQFDTVKRKKKKTRNLGTQSPRIPEDRNKTPEPIREMIVLNEIAVEDNNETVPSEDSERAKTPQPESACLHNALQQVEPIVGNQATGNENVAYGQRSKQQSRDSGFVGSCDDLLQHQKPIDDAKINSENNQDQRKEKSKENDQTISSKRGIVESGRGNSSKMGHTSLPHLANVSLSRKDSFNNWSSDEETNLMMSKMRQFFKTMVANSNGQNQNSANANSSAASPAPSPSLSDYSSKSRMCTQNRTKPPQLVYFENELTRLMKTVPGIRDDQVREIVEYLSSEDTWSDSYDSSDYTSSDLEGTVGGRRSALQEQISQSCQQIISKFDTTSSENPLAEKEEKSGTSGMHAPYLGRDTAFVYQKLVQSFTKITGDGVSSDTNSTPHSSPPLIAKVMHHIGSRLVALMHEVSEGGPTVQHHSTWRRYSQHHRTPSSASTTEDDDSTSDSTNAPSSAHLHLPRSKSHDPLLLMNGHPAATSGQEGEEREASDYERFSWRGSFESALMAADSRTKLSLLACSGDVNTPSSGSASTLAAKRRSAGDLLFNPKSFSREQLDRVRSCGSIGGGGSVGTSGCGGSIEERIWSNRRSSVPDANTRGESGASAEDEDTEDELEYGGESRATTLPRGMQSAISAATNSLPRLPASATPANFAISSTMSAASMHKAHSVYHFLPQHSGVKSARYRPPGFARNSNISGGNSASGVVSGPKRALSAPGLQVSASQSVVGKRGRERRQQALSLTPDDGSSLSEACSTPIIGGGSRLGSSQTVIDIDDMDTGLHTGHLATRASLSSLGARSDSMVSVYSGAGEGRCCRSVAVTGEVEFSLQYDYKHLTFEVHIGKCKNLAPVDAKRKRSDPYVKVYLLPDKSKSGKRKTKVKKHTLNPEFNETLKFHMSLSGLETRTLWLTVWHSDMFGRNDFLGEVRMPLENKIFDDPTSQWYPLQERSEPFDDPISYKGEVIVGLKFVPPDPLQQERDRELGSINTQKNKKNLSRGALHVLVKEARNLQTRGKNNGTCDPFCKSYLLPDKGRSGKQKTGVIRRSDGSPVWSHTFVYKDVSLQELAERGLELTVWDHDRIASNEFLGGVRFNLGSGKHYGKPVDWMDATGRELSLWQNMLERPNFWVEGAVTLRPNLHNHVKNNTF